MIGREQEKHNVAVFLKSEYVQLLDAKAEEQEVSRSTILRWIISAWAKEQQKQAGQA